MKTLKKLFSVSAIVALLGTLAPMYAFGANYSEEEQSAYAYAKAHGITTMPTIDDANMAGTLKRAEMAKMIAYFATDVLGLEPDTSAKCTFTDVTEKMDSDYNNGITLSCQLGLMGQGITAFRPNDPVTRGEFGTTLSRALNHDSDDLEEMNNATPYYKKHLEYLNTTIGSNGKAIMTDISNPGAPERRGWVMIMMERADGTAAGCSLSELMACLDADDAAACMAACSNSEEPENPEEPLVVKAGTLNVSATSNNGANIFLDGISTLDTIKLNASEEISVEKVVLEKYGYTVNSGIKVWLENENGVEITTKPTTANFPANKDTITLTIKKDYRNALETKAYVIVVEVADQTGRSVGDTLGFKVKDVTSSAETLKIASYTPATYSMVNYDASNKLSVEMKGSATTETYNYEAGKSYQVAKMRVKAGNTEISVNGLTLNNVATTKLDLSKYADKFEVKAGDTTLKLSDTDINKNGTVKLTFPEQTLAAKKYVDLTVNMTLVDNFDQFGYAVKFDLDAVSATETKTSARLTATGAATTEYTFEGTKVKMTNKKLGNLSAPRGKEDIVVAEGTLELAETINVTPFTITGSTGLASLELWLNGELVDEGVKAGNAFKFNNVTLEKGGKLQFVADLVDRDDPAATGSKITFTPSSFSKNLPEFATKFGTYDESNTNVNSGSVAGSISFSNITIETAKGTLENTLISDEEVVTDKLARTVTIFEGTYKANKGDVYLNSGMLVLTTDGTIGGDDSVTAYVTVGNEEFDLTFDAAATKSDTFSSVLVRKGETVNVKIETEVIAENTGKLMFALTLAGEDEDGIYVDGVAEDAVAISRVEQGSVTVTSSTAKDVVLRKNNLVLARFAIQPKNDLTTLDGFEMTGVTLNAASLTGKLKVFVDGTELTENGTIDGEKFTLTSGGVLTVTGLNMDMNSDGIIVEVKFTAPATGDNGDVKMNLSTVNGKSVNKKFTTKIVPALVKFTNQAINADGDETEYTIAITKADTEYEVSNLGYVIDGETTTGYFTTEVLSTSLPYVILNGSTAKYIKTICYDVDGETIVLNKADFEDYFRIGTSFLKVFKARD